jgi:hypothetical protein
MVYEEYGFRAYPSYVQEASRARATGASARIISIGGYELGARVLKLMIAFVPFFAFWELGRVIGLRRLSAMFFSKGEATGDSQVKFKRRADVHDKARARCAKFSGAFCGLEALTPLVAPC